jgi:hypothetical protein
MPTKEKPVNLASCRHYNKLKWDKLTEKDITEFDDMGFTLLHYAALHGMWDKLPTNLRDQKYWQDSKDGNSIYLCAYIGSDQTWIDKSKLTTYDIIKKNKQGAFIANIATAYRTLHEIPFSLLTKEVLLQDIHPYKIPSDEPHSQDKLIHQIARFDQLNCIPKELLTEELLLTRGSYGDNVYHIVSKNKEINEIPEFLWTKKALTSPEKDGTTPLHTIAVHQPDFIPPDIDLDSLLLKTDTGLTPLHVWADRPHWYKIPNKFLTKETLALDNGFGSTLLETIVNSYKEWWWHDRDSNSEKIEPKIVGIFRKADSKTLKLLSTLGQPSITKLLNNELLKRKVISTISKEEKSIEI